MTFWVKPKGPASFLREEMTTQILEARFRRRGTKKVLERPHNLFLTLVSKGANHSITLSPTYLVCLGVGSSYFWKRNMYHKLINNPLYSYLMHCLLTISKPSLKRYGQRVTPKLIFEDTISFPVILPKPWVSTFTFDSEKGVFWSRMEGFRWRGELKVK